MLKSLIWVYEPTRNGIGSPGLEPLTGEARVERLRAGDGMHPAPGLPNGGPDVGLRAVGHHDGTIEVIDVDIIRRR